MSIPPVSGSGAKPLSPKSQKINSLEEKVDRVVNTVTTMSSQVTQLQSENKSLKRDVAQSQERLQKAEVEIQATNQRLQKAEVKIDETHQSLKNMDRAVGTLAGVVIGGTVPLLGGSTLPIAGAWAAGGGVTGGLIGHAIPRSKEF